MSSQSVSSSSASPAGQTALPADKPHGVFISGETLEACNEPLSRALGLPPERLIGKTPLELSPPVQADGALSTERWQRREHAARAGMPQWFQWQFLKGDGDAMHALVHLSRAAGTANQRLLVEVHDLSRLRGAGWLREESEARLRNILENTKAVIFAKDREGYYIFANHELERAVRRPASEIVGRTDHEIWPAELAERFRRNDLKVLEHRQALEFEVTDAAGSRERTFHSFKFPLFDADGVPYAVCGIATDISERKRLEDALRSAALAVSSAQGPTVFQELARFLAATLKVDCAFIAVPLDGAPGWMRVLAFCLDGRVRENFDYAISGTACETVVGKAFKLYPSRLHEAFPSDTDFADLGFESYAGFPLTSSAGGPLGLVAIVSRAVMTEGEFIEAVLKIFAVRAGAELERMRGEEALRVSESSYRAIFEASEDAIFIHDWDTAAIVDVNPKACASYGYSYDEMKRLTISDISSNEYPYTEEEAAKRLAQAKSGKPVHFEWHRRSRDGSLHWDEVTLKEAMIGGRRRIVAFTREITERKRAEQALRASEEQYRQIFNASVDAMVLRDADYRVVDANPAALAMSGYSRDEVIGTDRALLQASDLTKSIRARLKDVLAGQHVHFEGKAIIKSGKLIDVEFRGMPVQYHGRPHVLTIARDLTERRRAESQRSELEAQLRQAQKMEAIGHLTGGIAHDFNNLLTTIMGYIVLAGDRQAAGGDTKLAGYLAQARRSCERARDLIQQMLTFSRGRRGEPRPLLLPSLVKESVKLFRSSLPSTVEIMTDLESEVPPVMLDPVHLDQVLLNLCLNARDAMNGVGNIRVSVSASGAGQGLCTACRAPVEGERVELCVEDDGPGIPAPILDRIFEPFFTTKDAGKGSGMGLATVHGIVHEHGGHVIVESRPGEGARIRVLFQAISGAGREQAVAGGDRRGGHAVAARAKLRGRVLLVDDEESVAGFMDDLLQTWGLDVTVAHSGPQARELIGRDPEQFDLVITDQVMPGITGMELAREMLAVRPDLPVILYTGFSAGVEQADIESVGIRAMLPKPVDPDALYRLLSACLTIAAPY
jgi:PAS domain S-box-containing protein